MSSGAGTADRETDRETEREADTQTDRETDTQTDTQTQRYTDTKTHTHRDTQALEGVQHRHQMLAACAHGLGDAVLGTCKPVGQSVAM